MKVSPIVPYPPQKKNVLDSGMERRENLIISLFLHYKNLPWSVKCIYGAKFMKSGWPALTRPQCHKNVHCPAPLWWMIWYFWCFSLIFLCPGFLKHSGVKDTIPHFDQNVITLFCQLIFVSTFPKQNHLTVLLWSQHSRQLKKTLNRGPSYYATHL